MAYTRVWDNSAPPGTALANTIDTIFQEFRQDTQQRISSLLAAGTDIDTDPLQLKSSIIGAQVGNQRLIQPFLGTLDGGFGSENTGLDGTDGFAHFVAVGAGLNAGNFDVAAPLNGLPIVADITGVTVYGRRTSGFGSIAVSLYTMIPSTPTYTLQVAMGNLPAAHGSLSSGVIAIATNTFIPIIRLVGAGTAGTTLSGYISGVLVTYNIAAGAWKP